MSIWIYILLAIIDNFVTVQPAELLQAKIHLKSPSAIGFLPSWIISLLLAALKAIEVCPQGVSHGLRSKCADLAE